MTDADKVMNPQHFGRDLADIWIRIRINRVIWIGIHPGSLLVKILALAEFALSEHSLVFAVLELWLL